MAETGNETQHGLILGALGRAHALLGHQPADVTHLNRALGLLVNRTTGSSGGSC